MNYLLPAHGLSENSIACDRALYRLRSSIYKPGAVDWTKKIEIDIKYPGVNYIGVELDSKYLSMDV